MKPLVSVIIPIYNAEKYLEETILSVINQTYGNFELLLINHNSTDSSVLIIDKYVKKDERVRVVNLTINKGGPAYPRNEGVKISKGEHIAFLDSDDVWVEEKLEKQLEVMAYENADIVHTLASTIDENSIYTGEFKNQKVFNKLKYILNEINIIYYTNYININSVLMKSSSMIHFNEDKNLIAMEDWRLWIGYVSNGKKVVLLEDKLLKYRVHGKSISHRQSDIGYRRSLYVLALLLLKQEIPLKHYIFSSLFNVLKMIVKNA